METFEGDRSMSHLDIGSVDSEAHILFPILRVPYNYWKHELFSNSPGVRATCKIHPPRRLSGLWYGTYFPHTRHPAMGSVLSRMET